MRDVLLIGLILALLLAWQHRIAAAANLAHPAAAAVSIRLLPVGNGLATDVDVDDVPLFIGLPRLIGHALAPEAPPPQHG